MNLDSMIQPIELKQYVGNDDEFLDFSLSIRISEQQGQRIIVNTPSGERYCVYGEWVAKDKTNEVFVMSHQEAQDYMRFVSNPIISHYKDMESDYIYRILKAWVEKERSEDSMIDWVKLMAEDLHRKLEAKASTEVINSGAIKNAEIIQLKSVGDKMYATLSYQDQNNLMDINNGYVHKEIPVNIRALQTGAHGGVLVDQSVKVFGDKCALFTPNTETTASICLNCGGSESEH